jgi:hypothetical protein
MAKEPSPHPRRRSPVISWVVAAVFAYGYVFVVFSVLGGVVVGFALLAFGSGLPSDLRRILGHLLVFDGVLAGGAALLFVAQALSARPAARDPRLELHVFLAPQLRWFEVAGRIVTAPTYLAPFSQQPCVLWHIALVQEVSVGTGDISYTRGDPVWRKSAIPDLEVRYDRTRTIDSRPGAVWNSPPEAVREGQAVVTEAPGGTITIPGGTIHLALLSSKQTFPLTATTRQILDTEGLPNELYEASLQFPAAYRVVEYTLTTGDFVRGYQQATSATGEWPPDPTAPFELGTLSQEAGNAGACGCLAGVFLVGALVLLILGLRLPQY